MPATPYRARPLYCLLAPVPPEASPRTLIIPVSCRGRAELRRLEQALGFSSFSHTHSDS